MSNQWTWILLVLLVVSSHQLACIIANKATRFEAPVNFINFITNGIIRYLLWSERSE